MGWVFAIVGVEVLEHAINPLMGVASQWELALGAKYLTTALVFQALLRETMHKPLLYRSLIALFCIATWIDLVGFCAWVWLDFDSSWFIFISFCCWLFYTTKRGYSVIGDTISKGNIFILFLRPKTNIDVIKSFLGFPTASVCIYANDQIWSFRHSTGTFFLYLSRQSAINKYIAVDTGVAITPEIEEMLDNLIGERRFPGTKCVWVIRHVLRKLGGIYAPRWCDYIPGIYAQRILKGEVG